MDANIGFGAVWRFAQLWRKFHLSIQMCVQGGVESYDALSLQVIFRERALYIVAPLQQMTCNLGHPMPLRHRIHILYSVARIS